MNELTLEDKIKTIYKISKNQSKFYKLKINNFFVLNGSRNLTPSLKEELDRLKLTKYIADNRQTLMRYLLGEIKTPLGCGGQSKEGKCSNKRCDYKKICPLGAN